MKKQNSGYSINFTTNAIVITKGFQKKASQVGTSEFNTLKELRKEFPNMTIVLKTDKKRKSSTARLTYNAMAAYIECLRDSAKWMKEFETVRKMSLAQSSPYNFVKQWFQASFPAFTQCPNFDEEGYALLEKVS